MTLSLEYFAPAIAVLGILWSLVFWRTVRAGGNGTPAMQKVADAILKGSNAFMKRQYRTIALLTVIVGAGITAVYGVAGGAEGWVKHI